MSRSSLRIVKPDETEGPDVDPDLLKLAHAIMGKVASGEVTGMVVFLEGEDSLDWDFSGEFDAYSLKTFADRRISEILDEMEGEGEEH